MFKLFISNKVNINTYNPDKQNLFEVLRTISKNQLPWSVENLAAHKKATQGV